MAIETGKQWDLAELLDGFFAGIEARYLHLRQKGGKDFLEEYHSRMFGYGEARRFSDPAGRQFNGLVAGVSPTGKLLLDKVEGRVAYDFKEVIWL